MYAFHAYTDSACTAAQNTIVKPPSSTLTSSWTPPLPQHCSVCAHLLHLEACLYMQQVALGAWVQQEWVAAEAEGSITPMPPAGLVLRLAPGCVVVLHIHLLTAGITHTHRQ